MEARGECKVGYGEDGVNARNLGLCTEARGFELQKFLRNWVRFAVRVNFNGRDNVSVRVNACCCGP